MIKKIIARLRLFWGLCPECNSDAPNVYDCIVCKQGLSRICQPSETLKAIWWARYLQKLDIEKSTTNDPSND